jgi:hypothetical protein
MGLDMYLTGDIYFTKRRRRGQRKAELYDLGYWRKHPNLHGFIVRTFADGEDDCQRIHLSVDDLRKIIAAVKARELPETTGFFFGESDGTEWREDVRIFTNAVDWLETEQPNQWRSVYYQASW